MTKPTNQDVDLTNYQIVTNLDEQQLWVKLPALEGDWAHIDVKALFEQKA
ncbi:hypothetical protein JCM19241_4396 [Vibrio ishigakensis]|uniref:Uncharacterized protein n=1 Tax=Vibrio ishigakensis TaxID=1481914 RepID=A0A0B8QKT0_9VIBR|nr:hypothetical protein JCM19241_4396 [Vibrio ishigakensis]